MSEKYKPLEYTTTADITCSTNISEQILGQETALDIIKKAAKQRRHVLLVGEPGTGKSMLGLALATLLSKESLVDILSFPNPNDENQPLIRVVPAQEGRKRVQLFRAESQSSQQGMTIVVFIIFGVLSLIPWWLWKSGYWPDVIYATSLIAIMIMFVGIILIMNIRSL